MEFTKTIILAEKLHEVIRNDSEDQQYHSSHARYGRSKPSTITYIFNGFNYGNNYNAYVEAMEIANYDPNKLVEIEVTLEANKESRWKLYCDTIGGTKEDKAIFTIKQKHDLHKKEIEGNRLLGLKSKKSHEAGQKLIDEVNDPKWKALETKQDKAMASTRVVNQWAWNTHNITKEEIENSFKETGSYTYITNWR